MKLIGLTGGMGSGKSTAVEFLKEQYGAQNVTLIKFAQPLYDIQNYIYTRISSVSRGLEKGTKDRFLLQFLGTEWGRQRVSDSIWIDLWKDQVVRSISEGHIIVADDIRYDNEAQLVKSMGGTVIEIISNQTDDRIDTQSGIKVHPSEHGIDPELVEYAIVNNGTIEEYKNALANTLALALSNNQ